MTIATSSTRLRHDSDAAFREWGLEFSTFLSTIGLVQTADTGQINWATVTRPGSSNTEGGYEVWRFDDPLQATAPIYIRFGYGTGNSTSPRIQMTVGVGTNGAGVITASGSWTAESIHATTTAETGDIARNSYFCYDGGTLAFLWKTGTNSRGQVCVTRTVDSNGDYTADGAMVIHCGNNWLRTACMNFAAGTITTKRTTSTAASVCHWPQSPTSSVVGSDLQVACAYGVYPRCSPHIGLVGCLHTEFPAGTTFSATMVGSTARTYLAAPDNDAFLDGSNSLKMAILWE